ncbi:MAG: hypothetical protein KA831_03235 [Pyrinomonadaceae bacterium]|nr:hypothetical protein [Acidobacteriota bacterium]MBK7935043.1 hypothetical protein [Acidobacteriota bacterium]MBP7415643.1 hypothetical protein [Pyrinomonadaceae bacterium]
MLINKPPEPWRSFLKDIDEFVGEETHLHLIGGFVVTVIYGSTRQTRDLDALTAIRFDPNLLEHAGQGSPLHKQHKVYLDPVGVATPPEDYTDRLTEVFAGQYKNLKLYALDPYDIALTKLERNTERDRDDVKHLARVVPLELDVLRDRYYDELRVYLGNPDREDLTLKLWIEMIEEER